MLANGRRPCPPCDAAASRPMPASSPARSSTEQTRPARDGPDDLRLAESPVARGDRPDVRRLAGPRCVDAPAGVVVGRGPWGNMFEFSVAFAFSMIGGYLYPAAALPDPLDRLHPDRGRAGDPPLRVEPAVRDLTAVPALQNPPLLTIHVGMAVLSATASSPRLRGRAGAISCRARRSVRLAPSHKVLDEVAYRRSSSASRSSRRSSSSARGGRGSPGPVTGVGTEGLRRRRPADLLGLPARSQSAIVGRLTGGPAARRRIRDGPGDVLRPHSG